MIGVDRFGSVFGGAPAHTAEHLTEHLRAVVRAGYSPVLLQPGTKNPGCILSARQEVAADREVQQRALQLDPTRKVDRMRHACGFKHVIEAAPELNEQGKPKDVARYVGPIVKRFVERYGGMNVGIHLGRSRLIAVDVDTPDERNAFLGYSTDQARIRIDAGQPETWPEALSRTPDLTVESPGSFDVKTQTWLHWGGGHWVFEVPEDYVFPAGKVLKGPGGWAAMWGESYILTPPSVRPEGQYRLVGGSPPAPVWLLETVTQAGASRALDRATRVAQASDRGGPIDRWSAMVEWSQLLEPDGWTETSMTEGSCGCPVWTAPGDHASPKSATAHEVGCGRFDTDDGWGPLKIWTDHPPDGLPPAGAVTKLQYAALTRFGGDLGATTRAFGIERDAPELAEFDYQPVPGAASFPGGVDQDGGVPVVAAAEPWGAPDQPGGSLVLPGPVPEVRPAALAVSLSSWATTDLTPYLDGSWSPPPPGLLLRTDGQPLLYPGRTHSIYGEPESGKTWIGLLACAQAIQVGQHVLVADLESDPGDLTFRLLQLGCSAWQIATCLHHIAPQAAPNELQDGEAFRATWYGRQYAVVLIDALAGAMSLFGLDPKSDADVTRFYRGPMVSLASTGACLIVIDHVIKDPDSRGRWSTGSERKVGALTGAAISVRSNRGSPFGVGRRGESEVWLAKDRAGALRGIGGDPDRRTGMQQIGTFVLDSQPVGTSAYLLPQPAGEETYADQADADLAARILDAVKRQPGMSRSAVYKEVAGGSDAKVSMINRLIDSYELRGESGPRGAQYLFYVELCDRPEVIGTDPSTHPDPS